MSDLKDSPTKLFSLFRYLGLVLFVLLLSSLDWENALRLITEIDTKWILLAGVCNFLFIIFKALRWHTLLLIQKIQYPLFQSLKVYQAGSFFSVITPGRIGDVAKITFLKRDLGIPHRDGLISVVFDRLFDLLTLALAATLFLFTAGLPTPLIHSVGYFCVILGLLTVTILSKKTSTLFTAIGSQVPLIGKYIEKNRELIKEWHSTFLSMVGIQMLLPLLCSLGAYLFLFLGGYLLAAGQNISLSFVESGYCIAFANIVALLPFSVAGIGTRDLTIVYLFAQLGHLQEEALLFSIGYLFINLIFANSLGAFYWFTECQSEEITGKAA